MDPTRRLAFVALAVITAGLAAPAAARGGHGLESALDHPYPAFSSPPPPPSTFTSGGDRAEWELVGTVATGNPHTDIDFFFQDGETYASVGTLGNGPNGGGQTIVQLTDGGEIAPSLVTGHPSAACLSDPNAALGLQHDVEATPKGGVPLSSRNPFAVRKEAQLLIDATDAAGRCHDQGDTLVSAPRGGLELIDITDVENPVEIGLTTHIGQAHTVNVDPKRPHIAYISTSDRIGVDEEGIRANGDPEGEPLDLDGIEVVDMRSCMNFPPGTSLDEKRDRCRPKVYRYRWPTARVGLGHTLKDQVWGCHEIEIYPSDLLTCGAGSALIALDMRKAFRTRGTKRKSDDVPRGRPLPCRARESSSLAPFATGATVVDCVDGRGKGTTDLSVPEWIAAGKPSLQGVRWLGSIRHMGRGSGGNTPTYGADEDIDFDHEAELSSSGRLLLATDERGGGVTPPGATCSPAVDNLAGNGGVHAYRFNKLRKAIGSPERSFRAYARTPDGEKAIFRTPVRTGPEASLCTAHVFQQIPGQNRIFMGWYSQGTHVLDFREKRGGRVVFKESGFLIPANANTWVSHVFDWRRNADGTYTYWGATGDFFLGAAGRSAVDVYRTTLPAPPKPRRIRDVSCRRGRWKVLMRPGGRPFGSKRACLRFARGPAPRSS